MDMLMKDLSVGGTLYALIKGEDFRYVEGTITNIGQSRTEFPKIDPMLTFLPAVLPKTLVDVTYTLEGKTYTDTVDILSNMFPTDKPGAITLIATSTEPIIRELRASLKKSEDYLKETERGIPSNKKKVELCKTLISQLDVEFAQKQQFEQRISKLEESGKETNALLQQILNKLK